MRLIYKTKKQVCTIKVPRIKNIKFSKICKCPVCNSRKIKLISQLLKSTETSQCQECSHMFHSRKPMEEWYNNWYQGNWDKITKKENKTKKNLKSILIDNLFIKKLAILGDNIGNFSSEFIKPGMNIIEIGTGNGDRLFHFKKFGAKPYGIEPSKHRAENCKSRGLNVKNISVKKLDFETFKTKFDFIYSSHVLEHVYDPNYFFEAILRILKPNGFFCIAVPNLYQDFLLHNFLFALHIHFYSPRSLIKKCLQYDMIPIKVFNEHQTIIFGQFKPSKYNKNHVQSLIDTYNLKLYNNNDVLLNIFQDKKISSLRKKKRIIWSNDKEKKFGFFDLSLKATQVRNELEIIDMKNDNTQFLRLEEYKDEITQFWVK